MAPEILEAKPYDNKIYALAKYKQYICNCELYIRYDIVLEYMDEFDEHTPHSVIFNELLRDPPMHINMQDEDYVTFIEMNHTLMDGNRVITGRRP